MNNEHINLEFEASAFRNWTVAYCQLAYRMWVPEFKRQFGWSISDICYEWQVGYASVYRAPSEHLEKLFNYIVEQSTRDPDYFTKLSSSAEQESQEEKLYFDSLFTLDFDTLSGEELQKRFREFCAYVLRPMPKFFIVMYFPQALELHPEVQDKYKDANNQLLETRGKIDKIAAPLGNQLTEMFATAALKRHNLDESLARFITIQEIDRLCLDQLDANFDVEKVSKRKDHYLVAGGEIVDATIENYLTSKGWHLKTISHDGLSGNVAFRGTESTIQGRAKLILNATMLDKVNSGDILISPMTTPEFAPVFPRVKAIITDEGGVTCHAAVTAREWSIPTIVGTKKASTIIQDNQLIELDLDNGSIKLIS